MTKEFTSNQVKNTRHEIKMTKKGMEIHSHLESLEDEFMERFAKKRLDHTDKIPCSIKYTSAFAKVPSSI